MCTWVEVPEESRGIRFSGPGSSEGYEPSDTDARNGTRILWKDSKCSSSLSRLSSPSLGWILNVPILSLHWIWIWRASWSTWHCYNRIPGAMLFIKNRNLFLTVLEAGSPGGEAQVENVTSKGVIDSYFCFWLYACACRLFFNPFSIWVSNQWDNATYIQACFHSIVKLPLDTPERVPQQSSRGHSIKSRWLW